MSRSTVCDDVRLIALCGKMGVGKGETGYMIQRQRESVSLDAWSYDLKAMCERMFFWENGSLNGDTSASRRFRDTPCPQWSPIIGREFCPREALQLVGTDLFRSISPDMWVNSTMARVDAKLNSCPDSMVVLTDTRFPNEVQAVRDRGGLIVQVVGRPVVAFEDDHGNGKHSSEWALADAGVYADYLIPNAGSLDDLSTQVSHFMLAEAKRVKSGEFRHLIE